MMTISKPDLTVYGGSIPPPKKKKISTAAGFWVSIRHMFQKGQRVVIRESGKPHFSAQSISSQRATGVFGKSGGEKDSGFITQQQRFESKFFFSKIL